MPHDINPNSELRSDRLSSDLFVRDPVARHVPGRPHLLRCCGGGTIPSHPGEQATTMDSPQVCRRLHDPHHRLLDIRIRWKVLQGHDRKE